MAQPTPLTGYWVKPRSRHRDRLFWHWVHRNDPTAYCGIQRPTDPLDQEVSYTPMVKCCKKCLSRMQREGP